MEANKTSDADTQQALRNIAQEYFDLADRAEAKATARGSAPEES